MSKPRTGAPKRVAVGLLAGALAMFGVALAPQAGASASVTTDRLAGTNRYGTAQAISASPTFSAPTTAIVATGENFPDALAASTLAGANVQAPIILTETGAYTPEAKAALAALKVKGVSAVTIVGGTSAIAQSVEDAIKADGFTVTRVAGDDRYETAAAIATAANTKSASAAIGSPALKTALIATGLNSPDALAAGPAAYANKLPLLLVNDTVPAETSNAIATLGIKKVVILGGTSAVPTTVEAQLVAATGNPATRLAGVNRYSTATAIADYEKATLGFPAIAAILANGVGVPATSGGTFSPDALAGGPLGGLRKASVLLTADPLSTETAAWLDANSSTLNSITAVGGTAVIPDTVLAAAKTSAQNVSNDSAGKAVTTRPELTGSQVVATVTSGAATPTAPAGTYVRYTFDEAIGTGFGVTQSNFHVYAADGTQYSGTPTVSTIETGNTSVIVGFLATGLQTAAGAATLTKATVDFAAIRDAGGAENPEGEAPIGTAGTTTPTAGTTTAPDLRSVGNFRQALLTGQTAVDFTFDQAAFVATSTGFHLVTLNNADITCTGPTSGDNTTPSGQTSAGGSSTTIVTVVCTNIGGTAGSVAGTALSSSNIARGYVAAGAVTTTAGGPVSNPLEASRVGGGTTGPDLVSVAFTGGTTNDTAVFTFDEAIVAATGSAFSLYASDGSTVPATGTGVCTSATSASDTTLCAINSGNPQQVLVRFGPNHTNIVGGNVTGTTTAPSGVRGLSGAYNDNDAAGTAGATSTTVAPGKVAGPDLTSVTLSAGTDAFGNANGFKALYTFDLAPTSGSTPVNSKFFLYAADGTRYVASACSLGTGAATSTATTTVLCTSFTSFLTGVAFTGGLTTVVLGTVDDAAVTSSSGTNPEGAAATTGGSGTPAS